VRVVVLADPVQAVLQAGVPLRADHLEADLQQEDSVRSVNVRHASALRERKARKNP
jgi:hypothetical protein